MATQIWKKKETWNKFYEWTNIINNIDLRYKFCHLLKDWSQKVVTLAFPLLNLFYLLKSDISKSWSLLCRLFWLSQGFIDCVLLVESLPGFWKMVFNKVFVLHYLICTCLLLMDPLFQVVVFKLFVLCCDLGW